MPMPSPLTASAQGRRNTASARHAASKVFTSRVHILRLGASTIAALMTGMACPPKFDHSMGEIGSRHAKRLADPSPHRVHDVLADRVDCLDHIITKHQFGGREDWRQLIFMRDAHNRRGDEIMLF